MPVDVQKLLRMYYAAHNCRPCTLKQCLLTRVCNLKPSFGAIRKLWSSVGHSSLR